MSFSTRFLRAQIANLKPFMENSSIETIRKTHVMTGKLMAAPWRSQVSFFPQTFPSFTCAWITPKHLLHEGIILYLHGGGYVAGNLDYAKGYGSTLAALNKIRVFCAAYRLAPESPFPAALEDALSAYRYLLGYGFPPHKIIFCGESAGGGLIYALSLKLKELGLPQPGGLIALSPWTDLTSSSQFYELNKDVDPSMSKERLQYYAALYTISGAALDDPLVSPLFGGLTGLPPSSLFVGGDEVMLGDTVRLHEKLVASGCISHLTIAPEMWHVYPLYGLPESKAAMAEIVKFVGEIQNGFNTP